jgi:dienelactone hydrolase
MKKFFRKIALGLAALCGVGTIGCSTGCSFIDQFLESDTDSSVSFPETNNPPLYQIDDVVKPDSLFDTSALFSVIPATKNVDLNLGENIQTFKFTSVPYKGSLNTWVFAAIGTPSIEMPENGYPAIVLAHGGGGTVSKDWMQYWMAQGYVVIAFDSFSNQLNTSGERVPNPEGGPKETNVGSNLDSVNNPTDAWIYHAVCGAIMSNNLLRQRDDVDEDRIVMTGCSWGGFVTCVTAGVDKRFAAFASTNGSGFLYNDTTWQRDGLFGGNRKQEWIDLYDASSYLPYATKPMMFASGVNDEFFSAYNRQASADLVKGKVFYAQRTNIAHANWPKQSEIAAFFKHVLYQENTLSMISKVSITDGVASFTYKNEMFQAVKFVYTTSTDQDSHLWEWQSVKVSAKDGVCSYKIPENTTAFLFETGLNAQFGESTEIVFLDKTVDYQ